ncbi:MAG: SpoIIE family protein phosphatase [Acidobacteria bacterium]|nr:SpoIIE family protein phosphatase [Acidobacteriota bacterium]
MTMQGARLEVSDPMGRTRVVPIEDDRFTIGRSHGNSLSLGSAEISRLHAEIVKQGNSYILRDLGSRAGTFVNDETVIEHTLEHGDQIRIGRHSDLRFLLKDTSETATRATTSAVGDLRQTATLLEGLRALGTAKVLDQVLAMVIDYAITLSAAERGFIMLVNPAGALEFTLGRGLRQVTLSGDTFQTSRKIPEQVFATGEPQLVADLHDELFAEAHEGTIQLGIRTVYCVPLKLVRYVEQAVETDDARPIGVLYLDSREKGSLRSRTIQDGLETLAAEAAVAIENARLYRESQEKARLERELHTAYEFQQGLLPTAPPTRDYFSAAAEMVPCLSIGGDFFDYLDLDGSFGFVLGDVAGKGAAAGLLGARVQEIFAFRAPGADPATTIATINATMVKKGLEARFVTLFYGILSPDGELTYCNAGHNPPLLVGKNGVRRLTTGGLIVGLFEEATYEQEVVTLSPGDTLITFSDGVSEASNAEGTEFGDERILECVRASPSGIEPGELVQVVLAGVRKFTVGEPQGDDITVLVVRYRGGA